MNSQRKHKLKVKYPKLELLFAALIAKERIRIKLDVAYSVTTKTVQSVSISDVQYNKN